VTPITTKPVDAYVDGREARQFRDRGDQAAPVALRTSLRGFEDAGEPIGEDDAGEDA